MSHRANVHAATTATFAAAVAVGLVVALGAAIESRRAFSEASSRRLRKGVGAIAIATLVAVLAGAWLAAGDPVTRIRHGWDTFKSGYVANSPAGSRLTTGLGSNRYDFYRVALDEFKAHPLLGIGADNFQQQYLRTRPQRRDSPLPPQRRAAHARADGSRRGAAGAGGPRRRTGGGRSRASPRRAETPRSAGARRGGGRARRVRLLGRSRLVRLVLGVRRSRCAGVCAAGHRLCARARHAATEPPRALRGPRSGCRRGLPALGRAPGGSSTAAASAWVLAAALALAAAVSLAAPWLSQLQVQSAARVWTIRAAEGLRPPERCGAVESAQRRGLSRRRRHRAALQGTRPRRPRVLACARERARGTPTRVLERGAIASTRGDRKQALELLERAVRLDPRDPLTRQALLLVREWPAGQRGRTEPLDPSHSSATRVNVRT